MTMKRQTHFVDVQESFHHVFAPPPFDEGGGLEKAVMDWVGNSLPADAGKF